MEQLHDAITQALRLAGSGDPGLWNVIKTSFSVSLQAILIVTPGALLIAFVLAHRRFPGREALIALVHTLLAVPAMLVALLLYVLFSHTGPLGDLNLLFTQPAMIIGQVLLSFPIVVAMSHAVMSAVDPRAWETVQSLRAPAWRGMLTTMYEVRFGLFAAVIAAFGRVLAEVGCSLVIGGNILHVTRNITTAIAHETSRGDFTQGIALGIVLLTLAFSLNLALTAVRARIGWLE